MSNDKTDLTAVPAPEQADVDTTPTKTPWFKNPTTLKIGGAIAGAAALIGAGYALNRGDTVEVNVDGDLVLEADDTESTESTD